MLTVTLLLLACKPDDTGPTTAEEIKEAETEWITDLSIETVADIGTTLDVTFSTATEGAAWVSYRVGDGAWQQTSQTAAATSHRLPVIAAPYAEVTLKVVADLDGAERESGEVSLEAGGLSPEAPVIEVTIDNYDPPDDSLLLLSVFGSPVYAMMVEFDGTVRWAHPHAELGSTAEGGLGVVQSVVPGQLLLNTFTPGEEENESSDLRRINLFGEVEAQHPTPGAHHFFAEQPDGGVLWLRYASRQIGNSKVIADELMRLPADGGDSEVLASLWDLLPAPEPPNNADRWDWTHANWLLYSPDRNSYLMSTANTNLLLEFDPDGALLQTINGDRAPVGEYRYGNDAEAFGYPHGIHWSRDGSELLILQRTDTTSSAVRYALHEDSQQIQRIWQYGEELGHNTTVLGEVQELPDGNYLVSWGGLGILQVVTPQQEVLWEAQTELGHFFSHMHLITDMYNARD